jgi:hypothetical protein
MLMGLLPTCLSLQSKGLSVMFSLYGTQLNLNLEYFQGEVMSSYWYLSFVRPIDHDRISPVYRLDPEAFIEFLKANWPYASIYFAGYPPPIPRSIVMTYVLNREVEMGPEGHLFDDLACVSIEDAIELTDFVFKFRKFVPAYQAVFLFSDGYDPLYDLDRVKEVNSDATIDEIKDLILHFFD